MKMRDDSVREMKLKKQNIQSEKRGAGRDSNVVSKR